mmetsp:Transcript_2865/g.2693  ORF Transcript_2865/g.2693 Transcript_2865/m.2693 type:complete len:132 (-) Transcript_2865:593-988(-)
MMPMVSPSLIWVTIMRTAYSVCLNGPYSSPLNADYLRKQSRGIGSALQSLGYVFGVLFASLVTFNLTKGMPYTHCYAICALFAVVFIIILAVFIKEPKIKRLDKQAKSMQQVFDVSIWMEVGFAVMHSTPL